MNEYEPLSTRGWSARKAQTIGLFCLILPALYVIGMWGQPGHGRPFMFSHLWGPESSHTTVGLLLLFTGMILSPMVSAGLGIWLVRHSSSKLLGWFLFVAGLGLLVVNLMTRQP